MTRKTLPKRKSATPYRRPDTYAAAARVIGSSTPHAYLILRGVRETTTANRRALLRWARRQADAGRADAPAVIAALTHLS